MNSTGDAQFLTTLCPLLPPCPHAHAHAHAHAHTHTHTHTHPHAHSHAHRNECTRTRTITSTHTPTHTRDQRRSLAHARARIHAYSILAHEGKRLYCLVTPSIHPLRVPPYGIRKRRSWSQEARTPGLSLDPHPPPLPRARK
jgi:hypothetical protein